MFSRVSFAIGTFDFGAITVPFPAAALDLVFAMVEDM
jgi:hypothetical protein